MSLVKNDPNTANAKRMLDFVLSDQGQAVWANAYLRPVRGAIPKDAQAKFLPASDYARAKPEDYGKMAAVQKSFTDKYLAEVH
jgi:putative spermidine/putrescine transport system substrate-binding protein